MKHRVFLIAALFACALLAFIPASAQTEAIAQRAVPVAEKQLVEVPAELARRVIVTQASKVEAVIAPTNVILCSVPEKASIELETKRLYQRAGISPVKTTSSFFTWAVSMVAQYFGAS